MSTSLPAQQPAARQLTPTTYALPGWMIDTITRGVKGTKVDAIREVRRVMCGAHRLHIDRVYVLDLLMDDSTRLLARQFAMTDGGRLQRPHKRREQLQAHWDDTLRFVDGAPRWTPTTVPEWLSWLGRTQDAHLAPLRPQDRRVMRWAIGEAIRHGVTRPALPVRQGVEVTGLANPMAVSRALRRLAKDGYWLRLAKRGTHSANGSTGKASTYVVLPALLDLWARGMPSREWEALQAVYGPSDAHGGLLAIPGGLSAPSETPGELSTDTQDRGRGVT